jgi:hypothetical protein
MVFIEQVQGFFYVYVLEIYLFSPLMAFMFVSQNLLEAHALETFLLRMVFVLDTLYVPEIYELVKSLFLLTIFTLDLYIQNAQDEQETHT